MSSPESPLHNWSLRRRLLWQLVLGIGLMLGALFLMLDWLVDREMHAQLDQFLSARVTALAARLEATDADDAHAVVTAHDLGGHTDFFAAYDAAGRLRVASANNGAQPLRRMTISVSGHADVQLPDGHAGRAVVMPLQRGELRGGVLELATERESWDATERRMHLTLLLGILLAIATAVVLCLLLVRKAFDLIDTTAQRLAIASPHTQDMGPIDTAPRELRPFLQATQAALRRSWDLAARERRFSRDVAHELRTPVAEVRANAEHALQRGDLAGLRDGMQHVLATNQRMSRGIEALLALARHESGQEPPTPDPLDLVALVRQQVAAIVQTHAAYAQRFTLALPVDAWVHCDAGMLERIVANLLQNAAEYGDASEPVQVAIAAIDDSYRLQIRNRASGIGAAELARFGERHWRAGGQDADLRHAGLGLALVFALADALRIDLRFALEGDTVVANIGPIPAL